MDSILMQVMQDRQADAMFLVRASDLRTFANALIQETGNSIAEKTFSAVKAAMGDKMEYYTREETSGILRVSYPTLHRWEKEKCLNPIRIGRKCYICVMKWTQSKHKADHEVWVSKC